MPYELKKVEGGVRVQNTVTGKVHAYHTSLQNAKKQLRLLNAIDHDKNFVPNKQKEKK